MAPPQQAASINVVLNSWRALHSFPRLGVAKCEQQGVGVALPMLWAAEVQGACVEPPVLRREGGPRESARGGLVREARYICAMLVGRVGRMRAGCCGLGTGGPVLGD